MSRGRLLRAQALLSLAALVLLPPSVAADHTNVLDFTGGAALIGGSPATIGWEFTVSSTIAIGGLGFWDEAGDGLIVSHEVGLWNADGSTLLASATVETGDTAYPSSSSDGVWRFRGIPRLVLSPGNYVAGATVSDFDLLRTSLDPLSITTIPELSYVEDRIRFTSSLEYPGGRLLVDSFGPNLLLANRGGASRAGTDRDGGARRDALQCRSCAHLVTQTAARQPIKHLSRARV